MQEVLMASLLMFTFMFSFITLKRIFTAKTSTDLDINTEILVPETKAATTSTNNIKFYASKIIRGILLVINYAFIMAVLFFCCIGFTSLATQVNKKTEIVQVQSYTPQQQNAQQNAFENEFKAMQQDKNKGIKVITADQIKTKFTDVAGLKEAKEEVQDIIGFLQNPAEFGRLGAKSPKGVLLYGEPGTGKTLLARAIAGESKVAFIAVSGSEFDEEYVGVGAARVRHLFELAREHAPCIIFIDEVDALAHKRHAHDPAWSAQTVNQLLTEMDGLDEAKNKGIVIIGASNRLEAMDPAVLRPGRLDRHIKLDIPTLTERVEVLNLYLKKVKAKSDVTATKIAKMTSGFSSAELANLVNEAAISATKAKRKAIEMQDFDSAKDRIVLGSKRAAMKVTEKERKTTAYHEAGHALVGHLLGANHNPIYKVTITPRGPSLGHTSFEPSDDEHSMNLQQLEALIATQLAGRIAEELIFGEQNITTGAENDLQQATHLAYNMVTRWGYSKRIGLVNTGVTAEFVSKEVIEQEVHAIMQRNYERAKQVLMQNRTKLEGIAKGLLEHETLDAKQIKEIISKN
jgi:ATP-dependent metalloprotease FtsH